MLPSCRTPHSVAASSNCAYLVSHLRILHDRTLGISLFRLTSFLALFNLGDHALEGLADVLVVARARLGEAAAQLFGEFLAVGEGDLALLGAQIGLVADDCEGDGIGALEGESLSVVGNTCRGLLGGRCVLLLLEVQLRDVCARME